MMRHREIDIRRKIFTTEYDCLVCLRHQMAHYDVVSISGVGLLTYISVNLVAEERSEYGHEASKVESIGEASSPLP